MRYDRDGYGDAWLDRLDRIVAGDDVPSPNDDELLHVAGQLTNALSPLSELDEAAASRQHRLGARLRFKLVRSSSTPHPRHWWHKSLAMTVAALIFLLLGPGILFELSNPSSLPSIWPGNAPTDTGNSNVTPMASDVILIDYGYYRDSAQIGVQVPSAGYLKIYEAHYLVYDHDVYLTRQPDDPSPNTPVPPGLKTRIVGTIKMIVDSNSSGQNILSWYEKGYDYRLISDLPLDQLVIFAVDLKF